MPSLTVFTVEDANRRLPYIRSIARDIVALAETLQQREECLREINRLHSQATGFDRHTEELEQIQQTIDEHHNQMADFERELNDIEVTLVDVRCGLIEVRSQMEDRRAWLNWKPDEPEFLSWRSDKDDSTTRRPLLAAAADQTDTFESGFQDNL